MNKHTNAKLTIALAFVAVSILGLRTSAAQIEDARSGVHQEVRASMHTRAGVQAVALSAANLDSSGQVITQTFTLHAGWNTIYIEVDPINPSPLIGVGLLFSVPQNLQVDLDGGTLSAAFRQAFESHGITLSADNLITITTETKDSRWLINDTGAKATYMVMKEGDVLNVYNSVTHELSTLEAVFATLNCDSCLESVWAWSVPLSQIDYIVDPAEGLWDKPGWKRYFPKTSLGPDGASREFLTDLLSLQANKGYLVKLKNGSANADLTVSGRPVAAKHRWLRGSYNLTGFPIDPDAPPTVATYFTDLDGGASPISEVRALGSDGRWGDPLAAGDVLRPGQAYLVYYDDQNPKAPDDYTAPLSIADLLLDGLQFSPGLAGTRNGLTIENLSSSTVTVTLSLVGGANAAVALQYEDSSTDPATLFDLRANAVEIALDAGEAKQLSFLVPSREQPKDGEGLLQIASADLGTRWLVPLSAKGGGRAGLWVGDVVVNDVSQARLGATNVGAGALTIELRPRDLSGIQGAAELVEKPAGNAASVALTVTLSLPALEKPVVRKPITGTTPFVRGYVYEDTNQNGQPDAYDKGFAGVTVSLDNGSSVVHAQTAEDGSYVFSALAPDTYTLSLDPQPPDGYTAAFDVAEPVTTEGAEPLTVPNAWPVQVTVDQQGTTRLVYQDYHGQQVTKTDFPRYDAEDNRVEPQLNFGFNPIYDASLWTGQCNDRLENRRTLAPVVNGILATDIISASLNPGYVVADPLLDSTSYVLYIEKRGAGGAAGQGIACGEIVAGAPTSFADGRGSTFKFRVLLRVDENGRTELLPSYETRGGKRVSSAAFSITKPVTATGASFGDTSGLLNFSIRIDPNDSLNPYKHKYHPDHDNLDAKFNPINFSAVSSYLWEVPEIQRHIQLELTEMPPFSNGDSNLATRLDWGGTTWGGLYKEVIKGIHKNDITVKGYFVIRQALTAEALTAQPYDQ